MSIKQSLKFLNTFSFSLENKIMLLVGQSHKVTYSIVVLDSIEMVNNPTIGEQLIICGLPDNDMFSDIAITIGTRVVRAEYQNIATFLAINSTLPVMMLFSLWGIVSYKVFSVQTSIITGLTSLMPSGNFNSTINTKSMLWIYSTLFMVTRFAICRPAGNHHSAYWAGMPATFLVILLDFQFCLSHISSITHFLLYLNLNRYSSEGGIPFYKKAGGTMELRQEFPDG